jgi:hypothetical protein
VYFAPADFADGADFKYKKYLPNLEKIFSGF